MNIYMYKKYSVSNKKSVRGSSMDTEPPVHNETNMDNKPAAHDDNNIDAEPAKHDDNIVETEPTVHDTQPQTFGFVDPIIIDKDFQSRSWIRVPNSDSTSRAAGPSGSIRASTNKPSLI